MRVVAYVRMLRMDTVGLVPSVAYFEDLHDLVAICDPRLWNEENHHCCVFLEISILLPSPIQVTNTLRHPY